MKILGTGLQGLVGSRIVELLSPLHTFENISRSTGVDITNAEQVKKAIEQSSAEVVLHLAAKADVDGCEKEKDLGENGEGWRINVGGTQNVANACETFGKKLIYISTDFIFDGEKEYYTESDEPNPINWYAQTKYEGEKVVQNMQTPWLIFRIAYPFGPKFEKKHDFVRAFYELLKSGRNVSFVTDHFMTPTYIDDVAAALDALFKHNATGIYHVVGSQFITPYDCAQHIEKTFLSSLGEIGQTTRAEFFKGRAQRPFRLQLKNDKIRQLGVEMSTFDQGLEKLKTKL